MRKHAKFYILGLLVLVLFFHYSAENYRREQVDPKSIQVGGFHINKIEIAKTDEERALGLSHRESIESDYGMLFIFEKPGFYPFWMKDMNFSIDMIWTDEDGIITGLASNVPADSYPKTYFPEAPSLYVLETAPGLTTSQNLKIGDKLIFNK